MDIVRSCCPHDCPDGCGFLVTRENGRAVRVAGDPEHPFTRGTLCPKTAHYERTVYSPLRLTTPLRRTGKKGQGEFEPVTWDEAIGEIARRWKDIIAGYGGEAIMPCSYAGTMGYVQKNAYYPLFNALGASEAERTLCTPAQGCGWRSVMGATITTPPQEMQKSSFIILWSLNPLSTNFHLTHDLRIARQRGARIVLIDCYRTSSARIADEVILTRPGTDGALALGIMHVLAGEGFCDRDFIARHVYGFERLEKEVLPEWTPEHASEVCGVPADTIRGLAREYGSAKAPCIRLGGGITRYGNGAMTTRLTLLLPALVGAWGRPGAGYLCSCASSHAYNLELLRHTEYRPHPVRTLNMARLGAALSGEDTKGGVPVKSLFVWATNPACSYPDQDTVIRGLQREDLFVVVSERFMTDTARYADIVLPTTTSFEHDDLYAAYGNFCVQRGRPVISPLGQCLNNWDICRRLAKAMGLTQPVFDKTTSEIVEDLIASTADSEWHLTPEQQEILRSGRPCPLTLPEGYATNFITPDGKIRIVDETDPDPLPHYLPPHYTKDKGAFTVITGPSVKTLSSSFNEQEGLSGPSDPMRLWMNPEDAGRLGLHDGQAVICSTASGHARFTLLVTEKTLPGCLVSEGVWWLSRTAGRNFNALVPERITDRGHGTTFNDIRVDVAPAD